MSRTSANRWRRALAAGARAALASKGLVVGPCKLTPAQVREIAVITGYHFLLIVIGVLYGRAFVIGRRLQRA
ncbi:MAG TPA: hypothetical protein VLW44_17560 [Streptosporangiaceae bacterium]|nr:hypothetical protein [Streptosporangiaceae bacterium]